MSGNKAPATTYNRVFLPGSYTWTAPDSGYYRIAQWGTGNYGSAPNGGPSGAHAQTVVPITGGQAVAIAVSSGNMASPGDTTVTLPDGRVVTTTSASTTVPGTATGGDINLNGSAGGVGVSGAGTAGLGTAGGVGGPGDATTMGGGAGAPGYGYYPGGNGADGSTGFPGQTPGAGGRSGASLGGHGLVIIERVYSSVA